MGKSRRAIPLGVRFEVFKRDAFMCRYCGRRPPEIELQVEHVIALVNGGTNDPANLLASCGTCNLGKNVKPVEVGALPPVSDEALARLEADLAKLRRMASVQAEIEKLVQSQYWEFICEWTRTFDGEIEPDEKGVRHARCEVHFPNPEAIKGRIREGVSLGILYEALGAASRAFRRNGSDLRNHQVAPYFFACLRNKISDAEGGGGC